MNYKLISMLCLYLAFLNHAHASNGGIVEIQVNEDGFSVANNKKDVYKGQTLRFVNTGSEPHRIQDEASIIDSGIINPGQSFDYKILASKSPPSDPSSLRLYDNLTSERLGILPNSPSISIIKNIDPVLLFPHESWVSRNRDFDILILFGVKFANLMLPRIPFDQQKNIEIKLDGVIYFKGIWSDFDQLSYVSPSSSISSPYQQGSKPYTRGYYRHIITIPANYLSVGLHVLTVTVTMLDDTVHVEEGRYIVIE